MSELPKEVGDREFQSYEIAPDGSVARKVVGSAFLTDPQGTNIATSDSNHTTRLVVSDLDSKYLLTRILEELEALNTKIDIIIG